MKIAAKFYDMPRSKTSWFQPAIVSSGTAISAIIIPRPPQGLQDVIGMSSGCKWMQVVFSHFEVVLWCIGLADISPFKVVVFVKSPKTTKWSSISLKGLSVTVLWGNLPRPITISDFLRWDHMMDHVWQPCRTLIAERSVDYHFQTSTEFQWSCRIQSFCNHFEWGLCSSQGN